MFRPLISLAFLATLTGCVSTPYVEPTGENVSTIKFHNQGRGNAEVYIYKEAAQCTGKQKAAEVEKMAYKNVTVLSDIPQSFSFGFGFSDYVSHKSCSITGTFTPKAKKYRHKANRKNIPHQSRGTVGVSNKALVSISDKEQT